MYRGNLTGAMLVDLSKEFDTVSHSSIMDKLPAYKISGNEKAWFTDYLFHRKMRFNYKRTLSTPLPIHCGVPQGSILGPLLFLLHFNELPSLLKNCKMIMYADDTVLHYSHKDLKEIEKVLSQDLCKVSKWLQKNELVLNLKKGKTEVMLFGTKKRLNQQEREIEINYQSKPINTTNSCKYLGVQLDPSLNMQEHFNSICRKASSRIRLLKKIRPSSTDLATLRLYRALIVPIITYCSLTNFYHEPYRKSSILALESRVCKLTNKDIPSVNKTFQRKVHANVFKCLNEDVANFEDYFELISHGKGTRSNNRILRTPKINLESTKKAFYYNRAVVYISLPLEIRTEATYHDFCKKLDIYISS